MNKPTRNEVANAMVELNSIGIVRTVEHAKTFLAAMKVLRDAGVIPEPQGYSLTLPLHVKPALQESPR